MILSMTGYGKASASHGSKKINIEVKSLNGKTTDIRFKLSNSYREKEVQLRNLIMDHAKRGKLEFSIQVQAGSEDVQLNKELFLKYMSELTQIEDELGIKSPDLTSAILRLPNVVMASEESLSEEEWAILQTTSIQALDNLKEFRRQEGVAMYADLTKRVSNIQQLLEEIKPFEQERIDAIRTKMQNHLDAFMGKENVDKNRYEQEVIFYMEKLDINEEKVRLSQHCTFFQTELDSENEDSGRKLAFIAQEMGREINTLGAKAQHSSIQKNVVQMKDELEKIKEQLANIV